MIISYVISQIKLLQLGSFHTVMIIITSKHLTIPPVIIASRVLIVRSLRPCGTNIDSASIIEIITIYS